MSPNVRENLLALRFLVILILAIGGAALFFIGAGHVIDSLRYPGLAVAVITVFVFLASTRPVK